MDLFKKILVSVLLVVVVIFAWVGVQNLMAPTVDTKGYAIVELRDLNNDLIVSDTFDFNEGDTFVEFLIDTEYNFVFSEEDPTYGVYIISINDAELGFTEYWAFFINGEYSTIGISFVVLENNAIYTFTVTDWSL